MSDPRVITLQTRAKKQILRLDHLLHLLRKQHVLHTPLRIQRPVSAYTSVTSSLPLLTNMDPYFQTSGSTPLTAGLLPEKTLAINLCVKAVLNNDKVLQCQVTAQQQGCEKVKLELRYQKLKGNIMHNTMIIPWDMRKLQVLQVFLDQTEYCLGGNVLEFSLVGAFFQKNVFSQTE